MTSQPINQTIADTNQELLPLYCANHPQIETRLRCKRCDKPICAKCAIATPTGYLCKECVQQQQRAFDTAKRYDYPIAFIIAAVLSGIGSFLATLLGFFVIILAPIVGVAIAEIVRAAVRRRRAKRLFQATALAVALGGAPLLITSLLLGDLMGGLIQAIFLILASTTAYQRFRGISI